MARARSLSSRASILLNARCSDNMGLARCRVITASNARVLCALIRTGCSSAAAQVPLVSEHLINSLHPQPFTRCLHNCTILLHCCCREGCRRQPVAVKRAPRRDAAFVFEYQARFQRQAAASTAAAAAAAIRPAAAAIVPIVGGCGAAHCCPHAAVQQQRTIDQRHTADVHKCMVLRS